jgi:hypothetical protein
VPAFLAGTENACWSRQINIQRLGKNCQGIFFAHQGGNFTAISELANSRKLVLNIDDSIK